MPEVAPSRLLTTADAVGNRSGDDRVLSSARSRVTAVTAGPVPIAECRPNRRLLGRSGPRPGQDSQQTSARTVERYHSCRHANPGATVTPTLWLREQLAR